VYIKHIILNTAGPAERGKPAAEPRQAGETNKQVFYFIIYEYY